MIQVMSGDCLEKLKAMESESVDSLVTDPPAGISFMSKDWDSNKGGSKAWIAWMREVMQECLRVIKPGAHALVWAIPRTSHWTATALEDAGFEIRDVVTHLFGSGFPKSMNISIAIDKQAGAMVARGKAFVTAGAGERKDIQDTSGWEKDPGHEGITPEAKQWQGWGTSIKPAVEMWLLVAKPFTTVPLDSMISEVNSDLRGIVCQQLDAKFVQNISMSNLKDLKGERSDFAQWIVVILDTILNAEKLEMTDTFKSPEMERTCLNIVLLWRGILDVLLNLQSKFTIKMETDLITELRILKFSISEPMQVITTRDEMNPSGVMSNVMLVESCLKSGLLRLRALMEISAPENVLERAGNLPIGPLSSQNYAPEIAKDVLSEHWILARKPLGEKTVAANVLKHGTGGINIDASRVAPISEKDLREIRSERPSTSKGQFAALTKDDKLDRSDRSHVTGRFPANLVLSGDAPELMDAQAGAEVSRFFYCAKASKSEKNKGCDLEVSKAVGARPNSGDFTGKFPDHDQRERVGNFHPTVKATKLMSYLINMVTPPGGVVLDPFMGSGSTGVAAVEGGFSFIGIEKDLEYIQIADKRIYHAFPEFKKQITMDSL